MRHHFVALGIMLTSTAVALAQATHPASSQPAENAPSTRGADADVSIALVPDSLRAEVEAASPDQILERFLQDVKASTDIEPAARETIDQLWQQRQADDDPRTFMTSVLAILSPPYKKASDALEAGEAAAASEAARPLVESSDPYLAAHAALLVARAELDCDRPEAAQKSLEGLYEQRDRIDARTFLGPEATFLLGYCRLANLDYEGAAAAFQEFEQRYPEAPEQYRLPVRQMKQELAVRRPEALGDVCDLMDYAGRQLKHARAGEVVRARQDRAVELLTKLIDDAQQQEQQQQQQAQQQQQQQQQQKQSDCKKCGGKGCPDCQKNGSSAQGNQPQRGAERSVAPPGQGRVGDLHQSGRARPGEQWGRMRPEERERVMQALRQNYPSRYRQLVEQYYKQLSKEE